VPATTSELSRRQLIGAAAAAGAAASLAAPAFGANDLDVSRLVRTALFVSDLAKSKAFYKDLLGLDQILFEGQFQGEVLGRLLGLKASDKVDACILKAEGPAYGMIGLFHVQGSRPKVRKKRGTVSVGEGVLVFYAPKLDLLTERVRTGGWEVVCPPVNLTPRFREMTFYGPDDQLINVIERDHRTQG
jgi:catechol 2,3-dioxygenase-like lactoylglutathione lyase family enzyme